jgi:hypothetical protein
MGKKIESPERLLEMWDEYKKYVDEHPDHIQKATGKGIETEIIKSPYLRQGFESFVYRKYTFCVHQYIDNWKGAYDKFLGVVTCMRKEWEADQIGGTMTGRYKAPNLVARLNGISDNQNVNQSIKEFDLKKTILNFMNEGDEETKDSTKETD